MNKWVVGLSAAVLLVTLLSCKALKRKVGMDTEQSGVTAGAPSAVSGSPGSTSASTPRDEWVLFSPGDGKFKVRMPQPPKLERHNTQTQTGPVELSLFTSTGSFGAAYQIGFSDFPEAQLEQRAPDQVLVGAQEGAVRNIEGRLLSERVLEVQGHSAREYSVQVLSQGMTLRYWGRIILVGARLYQLQVIGLEGRMKDADRQRFFDSFELREQQK